MGKRGSWFSAIKRVFSSHSKDTLTHESSDRISTNTKEKKKKGLGKPKHGNTSFIPLFREPSSIEQILGEAEREHKFIFRPPTPSEPPKTPPFVPASSRLPSPRIPSQRITSPRPASPRVVSPRDPASPRAASPRAASPRVPSPRQASPRVPQRHKETYYRPEPTLRNHHASATRIQASYRGYIARRSFRALKGLVRLQGVIRGQSVKRQTTNAMKYMQLVVRVQSQIQSRRIQMLENQARHQSQNKEAESNFGRWSQASEAGNSDWDDSLLTKEEIQSRMQRKVDAVVKRERAMSYAYSHQSWKATPKSAQAALTDIRPNGLPWWWNWLERQIPATTPPLESQAVKNFQLTPPRPRSEMKPSPRPPSSSSSRQQTQFPGFEINMDTPTPKSTRSAVTTMGSRQPRTPESRTPQMNSSGQSKHSRARASGVGSPFHLPLKDDDSLTSCPPFSAPNYMTPTMSAKAKVRATSNPKERVPGTPSSEKRRMSFPLAQGIGSFKWNKGSFFSSNNKNSPSSQKVLDKHQSLHSIGNLSVDSTASMPAAVGRKPFNRFV